MRLGLKLAYAGVSLFALATPVYAADAAADDAKDKDKEIVVTGTLVRGIAPAGANVIGVTAKAVEETGASTTAQLLQTIPQLGSFNDFQAPVGASNVITSNRPNLRNLPGFNTAGASPTLVLVDGHRVVGAGISVTTSDPDIVPPGLIERVEIVPDGGSAIYGSDAVAGVINFITKKKFNGVQVGGNYGFADNYQSLDANVTAGKDWGSGSAYIGYNFSRHDQLLGKDRDWVFYPKTTIDGIQATSFQCSPGNVTAGNAVSGAASATYAINASGALVAGSTNQCDGSDNASIYPKEKRHSVMAGLTQELTDSVTFDVRGFYTQRDVTSQGGQFVNTTNFGPSFLASFGFITSPFFTARRVTQPSFLQFGETQSVYYAWGPSDANKFKIGLNTWGIAPSVTAKLGQNWQLRWMASYGESSTRFDGINFDTTTLNNAIIAGLFNPYLPSSSDPVAYAAVNNWELYGHTKQRQFDTRLVLDGNLFTLPGGAVKLAAGAEYDNEGFTARNGTIIPGTENTGYAGLVIGGSTIINPYSALKPVSLTRNVKSAFGELVVPLFGADNATTGMRELTLSLAGRYDDYSDAGNTFNPKIGLTWKPFDALRLRGNWGKSFVAPSLADDPRTSVTSVTITNFPFLKPTAAQEGTTINGVLIPAVNNRQQMIILGNKPGIASQTAKTWSVGGDLDVPFVPGLRLSTTYWNIDYKGVIALPGFTSNTFYANFVGTPAITLEPTAAQVAAVLASADQVNGTSCGGNCYVIIDARKQNLQRYKMSGLDFAVNYTMPTGFGSLDFGFNGNYDLSRDQQVTPTATFKDQISVNASRFRFRSTLGANAGGLRAQIAFNHSQGYTVSPAVGVGTTQTSVKSFNVFDLFLKYDTKAEGILGGVSLTLTVNNVFDQNPPLYLQQNSLTPGSNGFANGRTLGRLVQFGISKKL